MVATIQMYIEHGTIVAQEYLKVGSQAGCAFTMVVTKAKFSFILVLILYPLVNTRAAPVGVREGTAQMVTPHVFIVVAMDRNACTPCKYHSQFAL
jgi:hypothetical protein